MSKDAAFGRSFPEGWKKNGMSNHFSLSSDHLLMEARKAGVLGVNADYRAQELLEKRAGSRQAASDSETKANTAQSARFKLKITTRGAPRERACVVRAFVRACVRTGCWEAASSLSASQFPGVLRARQMGGGDARWRQPRTPAPASRCSTARPGESRGCRGWSGLAWANRGRKEGWVFFFVSFFLFCLRRNERLQRSLE